MSTGEASTGRATRRPRRRFVGVIVAVVILVVLVVGVIVADGALRSYAQDQAKAELAANLPDGVTGDIDVEIDGFSFLQQYLTGSFDRVTITAPELSVSGVPVPARVVATGVPTDLTKPVSALTGTLDLSEESVNSFIEVPGAATLTLGDDSVGYAGSVSFLGLTLDYLVTAGVSVTPDSVVLSPKTASLTSGDAVFDASGALDTVLSEPIPLCVANYLPVGIQLSDLQTTPGSATIVLDATDFTIDEKSLSTVGTCP